MDVTLFREKGIAALGTKRKREPKPQLGPSRKSPRSLQAVTKPAQNAGDEMGHTKIPHIGLRRLPVALPPSRIALGTTSLSPAAKPGRDSVTTGGTLRFELAWSHFTPNLTPAEMLRAGVFGVSPLWPTCFTPVYLTVSGHIGASGA